MDIEQKYGRKDIRVIYNPILIKESEVVEFKSLHQKYGIEEKQFYYTVSQMIPHKNLMTLIYVMERIADSHRKNKKGDDGVAVNRQTCELPCKLLISGVNGSAAEELKRRIVEKNLQDVIVLTGYISNEERNTLYQNCSTFLFPSVFEGFGMPPVEAMLFHTPVVTTKCASIPEVTQGKAIYVNDPYSVDEWIEKLWFIKNNPAQECGQEKLNFEIYSPESISQKYLDFLKEPIWKKR